MTRVHVIVTAAGTSRRMGKDKLTIDLAGKPLLLRTLEAFQGLTGLGSVVVTAHPKRCAEFEKLLRKHQHDALVVSGGGSRQESVFLGLQSLEGRASAGDAILIHDGARPFLSPQLCQNLLQKLECAAGVIPAQPVRDTVKRVNGDQVISTEDRSALRLVQTPQAFHYPAILDLHKRARKDGFSGTDDASILEHYGIPVAWIPGPSNNLKVTVPEDLEILKHLFERAKRE